jgi:hypothetical protein
MRFIAITALAMVAQTIASPAVEVSTGLTKRGPFEDLLEKINKALRTCPANQYRTCCFPEYRKLGEEGSYNKDGKYCSYTSVADSIRWSCSQICYEGWLIATYRHWLRLPKSRRKR